MQTKRPRVEALVNSQATAAHAQGKPALQANGTAGSHLAAAAGRLSSGPVPHNLPAAGEGLLARMPETWTSFDPLKQHR